MKSNRFVAAIIVALIIGGAVTVVVLYSTVDVTSAFVAAVAIILAPIFLLAAYIVNARQAVDHSAECNRRLRHIDEVD